MTAGPASLFARIAAAPDLGRPALVTPEGTVRWHELLDRAERCAARLGAGASPVLVYGHKEPAVVVGMLAALRLGRAYVPVDPSAPPGRIARMLAVARPTAAVLAQEPPPALARELASRGVATTVLDPLAAHLPTARAPEPAVPDPETPAYIVFTSGTTGDPKGVPIPHRALRHFMDWLLATHAFAPGAETFLNQAPFGFDLSVMDLYGALLTGGTLFEITRDEIADPRRLFARLADAPLTVWVSTPSFARLCLAETRFAQPMLPALRRFLFCGETLPVTVARELLRRFPDAEVWNMYGPTETTVAVTAVRITCALAAGDGPLPVGRPAPAADVWIGSPDDPSRRLPHGTPGEIVIAGPQVAPGYLQAGQSAAFFTLGDGRRAYRSGDVGVVASDGLFGCAGRLDRQIKLHGYRIELEEIEALLGRVPGVRDAAVLTVDRDGQPDHLAAIVVAGDASLPADGRALTRFVRDALGEWLPGYALPRVVRRLPEMPLTDNGKVDRRALRETLG